MNSRATGDEGNQVRWDSVEKEICFTTGEQKWLQTKTKEFTRLTYTGLVVELEHRKIETRLIDEKFVKAMGEYVT